MGDRQNIAQLPRGSAISRAACKSQIWLAVLASLTLNVTTRAGDDKKPGSPSIFETARSAVAKNEIIRSPLVGTDTEQVTFRTATSDGGILIGFEVGVDKGFSSYVIRAIRPIYGKQGGISTSVEYGGKPKPKPKTVSKKSSTPQEEMKWVTLKAKAGYAVSRMNMSLGLNIQGLSLTYLRIDGPWLDRGDTYDSPWVGSSNRGRRASVSSDGAPIVGLRGNHDEEKLLALGLVYLKDLPDPEDQPAKSTAKAGDEPATQQAAPKDSTEPLIETYRNSMHHCNFILPKGWRSMPAKELDQLHEFVNKVMPTQKIQYDAGFRRRFAARPWEYPYVLMQVVPLPSTTVSHDEIEHAIKKYLPGALREVSGALGDLARNTAVNSAVLDRDRNLIVLRMQMTVGNMGKAESLSIGHISSTSIVFIHSYALEKDFDRYLPAFTEMNNSFYFDEGYTFKPVPSQKNKFMAGAILLSGIVGIGITALLVGAFFFVHKGSGPKAVVLEDADE